MPIVPLLVYVHILLMVFWIGTDIGVFVAGLRFMDPKRPMAERAAVIDLGMVIDRYPRICFVAILPVGLQIAYFLGLIPWSARWMTLLWLLSAAWMCCVIAGMILVGSPRVRPWRRVEKGFLTSAACLFIAAGIGGLTGRILMPGWLSGKLAAYGAMCLFALMLDRSFGPVFTAFGAISAEGSTPEREAALRRPMVQTYVWVLAIYAAVLLSGFLGTVKP
jgi:hypothetical protein